LEDLWSFNEEIVVRAIHACPLPVVTGVGHETDFTLADLAADLRAPTPSGAAELVTPDWRQWRERFHALVRQSAHALHRQLERRATRSGELERRLQRTHPGFVLGQRLQRLDELTGRLGSSMARAFDLRQLKVANTASRLRSAAPCMLLLRRKEQAERLRLRMKAATSARVATAGSRLAVAAAGLQTVSPLRTLERGYAIVSDTESGTVLRRACDLQPGQSISARLADGSIEATVTKISDP
jgi:exodeoxyribonuclease VII large subunit